MDVLYELLARTWAYADPDQVSQLTGSRKIKGRLVTRDHDISAAEDCAKRLIDLGFVVSSTSPRGVNFSGPPELFESVFHATLVLDKEPRFLKNPELPELLRRSAQAIYLPTQPTFFE